MNLFASSASKMLASGFLAFALLFSGCQEENALDCLKSTGKIVTKRRDIPAFNVLEVNDNVSVILAHDTAYFVEVRAGKYLQDNVLTEVNNNRLTIKNINKCNWVRSYDKPMEVTVHCPNFEAIYQKSTGTIKTINEFNQDTLYIHLTAPGDIDMEVNSKMIWLDMYDVGDLYLRGTNQLLNATQSGYGSLKAFNLKNKVVYMKATDDGMAELQATDFIGVTITGAGNIYYTGNPKNTERYGDGSGKLIQAK